MIQLRWIWKIIFRCTMLVLYTQFEIFNAVNSMKASFSCLNRTAGFYADVNASCKIYHTCDEYGNKFTYQCPEETAFRQDALICDHAHLVQCQGNTLTNTKEYIKEKEGNNSDAKNSVHKNRSFSHSFHVTQPRKMNDGERHGSVFNATHLFMDLNKTKPTEKDIRSSFYSFNYITSTTSIPINYSINTRIQSTHNENALRKNENYSIQSQNFHEKNKLNEKPRSNQKDYLYQKINDASYKTQENNINYQATKNPIDLLKLPSINYRNYPYLETLKSIQKNTKIPSTTARSITASISITELPVYALTLSLKPLIPSELEYDPYYPKFSTTTESYYTSTHNLKEWPRVRNSSQILQATIHLKLPSVLPDLNSLDDIVDRRKLLYIPRIKFN
ncbi:uncharacterized protein LOC122533194 isoform X1 [Frieseomelitta varia]|uniref:uncharacterized protein LOC122533194 isoform X1 n=2 Tax=Frieseomelitta varia TaxID=561572 RepID=UPI001CB6A774|nr:uncharacterized protein LOC122533194 isoform X1 [Frieseomelitta varia]